jgi:heme/copper-type cytochrome/quinol oxidase subunit 3
VDGIDAVPTPHQVFFAIIPIIYCQDALVNLMQYMNRQVPLSQEEKQKREEEQLQRAAELKLRNNRLGVTVFQFSWIMAFLALIFSYWLLGFSEGWRPSPEQAPNFVLPTIATIALIVSGLVARQALKVVMQTEPKTKVGLTPAFSKLWLVAMALGIGFVVIMLQQFFAVPYDPMTARFGLVYRLMIGYHAFHAIVTLIMFFQVWRFGADHRYHRENFWAVEGTAKLWYFVIVAWLLFYIVLYLPFTRF